MDTETSTSVVSKRMGKILKNGEESQGHLWEAGSEEGPAYTMQLNTEPSLVLNGFWSCQCTWTSSPSGVQPYASMAVQVQ